MQLRLPKFLSVVLATAALTTLFQSRAEAVDPQTLADCEDEYARCFDSAGFFGYFVCPQQYNRCVAEVRRRLPPEITQTLDKVNACQRTEAVCRTTAEGDAEQLGYCTRKQTVCIMDAFGIEPPVEGPKDTLCIQGAVMCLNASESANDFGECGQSLRNCLSTPPPPL